MATPGKPHTEARLAQAQADEERGNIEAAQQIYRSILASQTLNYHALTRLALLEYRANKFDSAISLLRQAVNAYPDDFDVLFSLGVCHHAAGQISESVTCFEKCIQLRPGDLQPYLCLASAFEAANQVDAALGALKEADQRQLLDAGAQCRYARLLEHIAETRTGRFEDAIAAYRTSIRLDPANSESPARLALVLEKTNQIEEAETVATKGLLRTPDNPWLKLALAKCRYRQHRYTEGIACLDRVSIHTCPPQLQMLIASELGALYDKSGACDKAYEWFALGNAQAQKLWTLHNKTPESYISKMERLLEDTADMTQVPAAIAAHNDDPVFLVGFPRSGTTLLDQILDSHAGIHTLEEIPVFDRLLEKTGNLGGRYPRHLDRLSATEVVELKKAYFDEVSKHTSIPENALFVDKLPLNIGNLLLINRLFPNARYILAVRHPCDVCLSCFMQSFSFTTAMASFFKLESTVQLYDLVMRLWLRFVEMLDLNAYQIRYEDVVEDLERESRQLLEFLGMEWDENVLQFDRHARGRLSIKTPSYRQVRQPIYGSSVYRWQGYRRHFEPLLPLLQPYIDHFDYRER